MTAPVINVPSTDAAAILDTTGDAAMLRGLDAALLTELNPAVSLKGRDLKLVRAGKLDFPTDGARLGACITTIWPDALAPIRWLELAMLTASVMSCIRGDSPRGRTRRASLAVERLARQGYSIPQQTARAIRAAAEGKDHDEPNPRA